MGLSDSIEEQLRTELDIVKVENEKLQMKYDFQGIALERLKQITKELQKTIEQVLKD